jgi:hypothetical protein
MPTFKAPQHTKITNPRTGALESCYVFNIEFAESDTKISFVADSDNDITLQNIQKCVIDNITWWNGFISEFLKATSKLFAKPYTVENINKIAKHSLISKTNGDFPSTVILIPKSFQISGSNFIVNWDYTIESIMIDIPDLEDETETCIQKPPLPADNKVIDGMEELNIDEIPVGNNSTEILEVNSPAKFYDRQRIKEARLKAKLAIYKVQRQMAKYYDKYGEDISESDSDSESEYNSSDEESQNEYGVEEVQL